MPQGNDMDKELKAKWIKALRSGKYKQARSALVSDRGYCCLGVLSRVLYPDVKKRFLAYPPCQLISKAKQKALANRNDGFNFPKHDFKQIADYIEEKL